MSETPMTSELICLRCKAPLDINAESCPQCNEKVTQFQRTYAGKLIDGKYQILERLGVGGMGEIFKVLHIHLREQRVIKIMRANIATDEQALQRFLHEAKLATMIKHRNLAMLYDFSTLDDGSYYMVWEFIDGTNILKWIAKNGPMPPRLALEIAIQALSGLEQLHQMGIIHRDISPENIMLSQDYQGKLLVKVIDFGIAKQLSDGESGQGLTQTGMFLGKLKYASPEQAGFMKEGEHLDARSDQYSFGIVLYEMLAGRAPFLATNPHGYILKHATEKPLPVSQINPETRVPQSLEAVLFKSLEKDRDNRHKSTGAFISELESLRSSIAPDEKYGLGEKMITLSSAPTLVDTTKPGVTGRTTRPAPTVSGRGAEPTVLEPSGAAAKTVVERADASSAPTMVESLAGSAPTQVEAKQRFGSAAPTVIEPIAVPAIKRKPVIFGAAAAVLILLIAVGIIALRPDPDIPETDTVVTATTTGTAAPLAGAGGSVLLLTGNPFVQLQKLEYIDKQEAISVEDDMVPLRVSDLEPGRYRITLAVGSNAETKEITIGPSETVTVKSELRGRDLDLDKIADEILKQ